MKVEPGKHNDIRIILNGKEVTVDSPIAEVLTLFNEKGFQTLYSCAGSMWEDTNITTVNDLYFMFDFSVSHCDFLKLMVAFKDIKGLQFEEVTRAADDYDREHYAAYVSPSGLITRRVIRKQTMLDYEHRDKIVQRMTYILKEVF